MKKSKKVVMIGIAIAVVCALSCILAACNGFGSVNDEYDPWAESAADGSLEISIDEVKAMLGNIASATVDEEGNLIFELKDHSKVNVGKFDGFNVENGEDGADGMDGVSVKSVSINADGELVIEFSNGMVSTLSSVMGEQGEKGEQGADGVGIVDVSEGSHENGYTLYTITYSDGSTDTISIKDGQDGVGVKSVTVNAQGQFVVTYTNNRTEILTPEKYTLNADVKWFSVAGGVSASTYYISTAEDFAGLANLVNEKGVNFSGKTIILKKDIDLSSVEWNPIGGAFAGTLDGNGKNITGLNFTDSKLAYAGLFQQLDGATIKNLTIVNVNISDNDATVGAIAGKAVNSTFENVSTGGKMAIAVGGGLVGEAVNSTFTDCSNGIDITAALSKAQAVVIGGIAAKVDASTKIENCANSSDITLNLDCMPTSVIAGQIIGGATPSNNLEEGFVIVSSASRASKLQNSFIAGQDRHGNAVNVNTLNA